MTDPVIESLKEIKWKEWGSRRITIRTAEHWTKCALNFKNIFDIEFPDQLFIIKDEVGRGYFNDSQLKECVKKVLKKVYQSSFYDFYEKKAIAEFEGFLSYCKKIAVLNLSKYAAQDLLKLLDEFLEKEDVFTNYLWIIFFIDEPFSEEFEKRLKANLGPKNAENAAAKIREAVFFPEKKSAIFRQTHDILNTANDIKQGTIKGDAITQRLKLLQSKYSFFPILNFDEEPPSLDFFKQQVYNIVKKKNINPAREIELANSKISANKKEYEKFIAALNKDDSLEKITQACHKIAFYREHRNDIRRESYFYARKLYMAIAKKLEIDLTALLYMTRDEIRTSLKKEKKQNDITTINKRKEFAAIAMVNKEMFFVFDAQKVSNLFEFLEPKLNIEEFKGVSASPGHVRGKVKLIMNITNDAKSFKDGDILVASMTNLDFVPLMSKASAIVTNEGGLLCHAAIIAREMKKPCVVGTSIATKVLKDGYIIEVDATLGIVKIIKKF